MTTTTTTITVDDDRAAAAWLNYPGNVVASIADTMNTGAPMGPNAMGEFLWPVSAEYDAETDRTRVGLSYVGPVAS